MQRKRGDDDRLTGWKALANFFGKDRTTVMRWAKERGLPIYRVPGGKQGSIYALRSELTAWLERENPMTEDSSSLISSNTPSPPDPSSDREHFPERRSTWRPLVAAAIAAVGCAAAVTFAYWEQKPLGARRPLANPEQERLYLAARDAWGRRTPTSLRESIALYRKLSTQAPDYALADSGLAEAWLALAEYGDVAQDLAVREAEQAARRAVRADPRLDDAHRVLGYIAYWADDDPQRSVARFKAAIAYDPDDLYNHFWYANVLADIGHADAAERHYSIARLHSPGSRMIEIEHACAQWQAGRDDMAITMLDELNQRYPKDPTIHNCLMWIHLGRSDARRAVTAYRAMALLRNEPNMVLLSQQLVEVAQRSPQAALHLLLNDAERRLQIGQWKTRATPAYYASAAGDRAMLLRLLRDAGGREERWHSVAVTTRIAAKWRSDREVIDALKAVTPPRVTID